MDERAGLSILHCVPSLHVGGVNRSMLATLGAMADGPDRHTICVLTDNLTMAPEFEATGAKIVSLGHAGGVTTPRTLRRLRQLLRAEQADVVHSHLLLPRGFCGLVTRFPRVPHVASLHGASPDEFVPADSSRAQALLLRATHRFADDRLVDEFIAVSTTAADFQVALRPRSTTPITVVHNGIVIEDFAEPEPSMLAALRAEIGLDDGVPLLLNVGRMVYQKNQVILAPIMEHVRKTHPEARLVIIGRGEESEAVQAAVDEAGLGETITLLGIRTDVPAWLRLADVVILSSIEEGFGMLAIEASAAERPLVSSDLPSVREIFTDEDQVILVDPLDPLAFSDGICQILDHPDEGRAMAERARRHVTASFSSAQTAAKLTEVYLRLARGRAQR